MVRDALQIARHQQRIQRLLRILRLFVHGSHEHNERLIAHPVHHVVHFQNRLRQLCLPFHK